MTKLTKPVIRETSRLVGLRPILVTVAPCGGAQSEARIGLRLKGKRQQYVALLSDLYRTLALWHGQKEAAAKRQARKLGVPWKQARVEFQRQNRI